MKTFHSSCISFAAALLLLSCPDVRAQGADSEPNLLQVAEGVVDPFSGAVPAIKRSRAVTIDVALLAKMSAKDNKVCRFELFADRVFRARFERKENYAPGRYNWYGSLVDHPGSNFVLAVYDGAVAASFFPKDKNPLSLAIQGAPGMHVVRELDRKGWKCGSLPLPMGQPVFGPQAAGCSDNPDDIAVMIVYDKGARFWAGSHAKVAAEAQKSIGIGNNVNKASLLSMRFRLTSVRAVNYTTAGFSADLNRLTYTKGQKVGSKVPDPVGYLDEVHGWRKTDRADLVQLIVGFDIFKHGATLGVGWTPIHSGHLQPSSGFSVILYLPIDALTMTHELGHNFGCQHDIKNVSKPVTLLFPYALGFKYFKLFGANFTTVMGYPELFQGHLGAWSTPLVKYQGVTIGSKTAADNRQVIVNTRQRLADYSRVLNYTNKAPVFVTNPVTVTRCEGYQTSSIIMSVRANGASSYQWYRAGKAMPGQTSSNLVMTQINLSDATRYFCKAINSCGSRLSGTAYIKLSSTCRTRRYTATASLESYGWDVNRVGDLNRDGYEDFVIGAPTSRLKGSSSGRIEARSGKDGSVLMNISFGPNEYLGYCVAGAGDVNQDGYADIIVGAPLWSSNRGYVRVISGKTRLVLYTFLGDKAGGSFGLSVCGAGDLDGDGHPDLAVGAPVAGLVRFFSGKTGKVLWNYVSKSERAGQSVAPAGDVDQDGFDDVLVGATGWSSSKGYVRILSVHRHQSLGTVLGTLPGGQFGFSVTSLGDLNKDGVPDFAAAAPYAASKGSYSGFVQAFSGKDRKPLWSRSYAAGERLGYAIAAAGDVNGDGIPDLHVSAPYYKGSLGYVRTLSGKDGSQLAIRFGAGKAGFGRSVSGMDGNGDATPDLLVGDLGEGTGGGAWLFDGPRANNPPELEFYGAACFSSKKTLPRMGVSGRPSVGKLFRPEMFAAAPSSACILSLDLKRSSIGLAALGATGCTVHAMPLWSFVTTTNATGQSSLGLPIPNSAKFIGGQLYMQWLLIDLTANGLGIVPSTALRIRVGRQ